VVQVAKDIVNVEGTEVGVRRAVHMGWHLYQWWLLIFHRRGLSCHLVFI
jgi:hypothetical protein